jgi:hypothetical protein
MDCRGCKSLKFLYPNYNDEKISKSEHCITIYDQHTEYIVIPELCPCRMCIVKSMCDEVCEEFKNLKSPHMQLISHG